MNAQLKEHLQDLVGNQAMGTVDRLDLFKSGVDSLMAANATGTSAQSTVVALNNWIQGFVVAEKDKQQDNYIDFCWQLLGQPLRTVIR